MLAHSRLKFVPKLMLKLALQKGAVKNRIRPVNPSASFLVFYSVSVGLSTLCSAAVA